MTKPLLRCAVIAALSMVPAAGHAQMGVVSSVVSNVTAQRMTDAIRQQVQMVIDAKPEVNKEVAMQPVALAVAEAQDRLAVALSDGQLSLWDFQQGREVRRIKSDGVSSVNFSDDGAVLLVGHADGSLDLIDSVKGKSLGRQSAVVGAVMSASLSTDRGRLLVVGSSGAVVLQSQTGKTLASLSPSPSLAAAQHPDQPWVISSGGSSVTLAPLGASAPLWSVEGGANLLAFSADGSAVIAVSGSALRVFDSESGKLISSASLSFEPTSLQPSLTTALVGNSSHAQVVTLNTGAVGGDVQSKLPGVSSLLSLRNGSLILGIGQDAALHLLNAKQGEQTGMMLVGHDGWAVLANSGDYDAEHDGVDTVSWVASKNSFALDQFAETHYQPGVLPRLLTVGEVEWRQDLAAQAGKASLAKRKAEALAKDKAERDRLASEAAKAEAARLQAEEAAKLASAEAARVAEEQRLAEAAKKVVVSKSFGMPPSVAFDTPKTDSSDSEDMALNFSLADQGGGIDEVRIYQNGKLVFSQKGNDAKAYLAKLAQGPNEFRLVALSSDRIESRPAKIKVSYTGAERKSSLYVLAVGVSKYKNPALNLNYGAVDAKGIADYFQKQQPGIYKDIVVRTLYDEQANKANILAALSDMKDTKPEDTVVIYMAGHGDTIADGWYFMPTDVRYPEREDEVRDRGLASADLNAKVKEMGAQKVLMLMDACKSGAAMVAFRGFEDRKAMMQVARASGVHVVAAAGKEQFAAEMDQLGHGLFTYTLLEGLSGKADHKQAKMVTVRNLTNYIEDQLPEISQNLKGTPQFPVVDSRGMDFPVAMY